MFDGYVRSGVRGCRFGISTPQISIRPGATSLRKTDGATRQHCLRFLDGAELDGDECKFGQHCGAGNLQHYRNGNRKTECHHHIHCHGEGDDRHRAVFDDGDGYNRSAALTTSSATTAAPTAARTDWRATVRSRFSSGRREPWLLQCYWEFIDAVPQ